MLPFPAALRGLVPTATGPRRDILVLVLLLLVGLLSAWTSLSAVEYISYPGPTVNLDEATQEFTAAPDSAERGVFLLVTVQSRPVSHLSTLQDRWSSARADTQATASLSLMAQSKVNAWQAGRRAVLRAPAFLPHSSERWERWNMMFPAEAVPVVRTQHITGSSGGLALGLEMADGLTPGELTDTPVAATGEIGPLGTVWEVGGVPEKVLAAHRDGATLLFVPEGNFGEAVEHAPRGMSVVRVRSLGDAIEVLCERGADDLLCQSRPEAPERVVLPRGVFPL